VFEPASQKPDGYITIDFDRHILGKKYNDWLYFKKFKFLAQ
jgi:hypothetical protein